MRRAGTLTPLCARALGCCNPFAPLEGRGGMGCVCCWGRRCPPSRAGPQWLVLSPIVSGGGAAGTHPATHPDAPTLAPGALVCGRLGPAPPLTPSWAPPTSVTWLIMLPLQRALLSSLLPSSPLPGPAPPSWQPPLPPKDPRQPVALSKSARFSPCRAGVTGLGAAPPQPPAPPTRDWATVARAPLQISGWRQA